MKRSTIIAALLVAALAASTGCTVFQMPTPKNNLRMNRNALVKSSSGNERTAPVSTLEVPEQWATGAAEITLERTYENFEGSEVLVTEKVAYKRTSDAGPAAALAGEQAQRVVELGATAGAFLGTLAATMGQVQLAGINANRDVTIATQEQETRRVAIQAAAPTEAEHTEPAPETTTPVAPAAPTGS